MAFYGLQRQTQVTVTLQCIRPMELHGQNVQVFLVHILED
jgi:hypothetical protein